MGYSVRKTEGAETRRIYGVMRREVRSLSRMPLWWLLTAELLGHQECLVVEDEIGYATGYAICSVQSLYGYVLINFIGLEYDLQSMAAMERLVAWYGDRQGIIAELTVEPGEKERFEHNLDFYRSCGFKRVRSNYILAGKTVQLMVRPIRGAWDISTVAHRVVTDIYSAVIPAAVRRKLVKIKPIT